MGRSTKLTPHASETICEHVRAGLYLKQAAAAVGIHPSTLHAWTAKGEQATRGIYREFRDSIKKAEADFEASCLARIQRAADDGTWTAAAWMLERRWPGRWGRRVEADAEAPDRNEGAVTFGDVLADMKQQYQAGEWLDEGHDR